MFGYAPLMGNNRTFFSALVEQRDQQINPIESNWDLV